MPPFKSVRQNPSTWADFANTVEITPVADRKKRITGTTGGTNMLNIS
jgi:hypothetical protein